MVGENTTLTHRIHTQLGKTLLSHNTEFTHDWEMTKGSAAKMLATAPAIMIALICSSEFSPSSVKNTLKPRGKGCYSVLFKVNSSWLPWDSGLLHQLCDHLCGSGSISRTWRGSQEALHRGQAHPSHTQRESHTKLAASGTRMWEATTERPGEWLM